MCCVQHVSLAYECTGVGCTELVDKRWRKSSKESINDGPRTVKNGYERLGPKDPQGRGRTILVARIGNMEEQEYMSDKDDVNQSEGRGSTESRQGITSTCWTSRLRA